MDFFFNSPLNQLVNGFGANVPLSSSFIPPAVRGSPVPVRFIPFTGIGSTALPFALPASYDLRLTAKLASESGDDPTAILSASGFLYDPVTGIYSGLLDTGTVQVVQAFVGASLVNAQAASYAPVATDVTKLITVATAGASNITLPLDAVIAPGTPAPKLWLMATGAGPVTVLVAATMNALVLSGLTTAVLTPGVPVLAIKTAANTWTLSVPPEVASINLNAEWSYADITITPLRYQRIPAFVLQVSNWIFNGGEGSPANTGDPSAYALAATVAAEVTRATAAESSLGTAITTAVGAEATARTNAINAAIGTEVTNRNSAVATESTRAGNAEGLLLPKLASITALVDGSNNPLAAYTLATGTAFTRLQAAYAGPFALTVPLNSVIPLAVGSWWALDRQIGGGTTITPVAGVTLNALDGVLAVAANDAGLSAVLVKTAINTWQVVIVRPPIAYEVERAVRLNSLADVTVSAATVPINLANGTHLKLPFGAFATRKLGNPTNRIGAGSEGWLIIKQDASGARLLTFDTLYVLPTAITLNAGANAYTVLRWFDDGTNIYVTKAA